MRRSLLVIALSLVACSGGSLDLGATQGEPRPVAPPPDGPDLPVWPTPDACSSASDADLVGVWEGVIQSSSFEPLLSLRADIRGASASGGVCGTVLFGQGGPIPPATDPDAAYPPSAVPMSGWGSFYEGVTYTIVEGGMQAARVSFTLDSSELWIGWCELQTPSYVASLEQWLCIPGRTIVALDTDRCRVTDEASGLPHDFSMEKCSACGLASTCACNHGGCTARPLVETHARFALEQVGNELFGSIDLMGLRVTFTRK